MKVKRFMHKVVVIICILLMLLSLFSTSFSVFAAEAELPVIQKWVNGAALSEEGVYLHDTWALDESGISEHKYVLINQESTETFRVKNYPDDITTGATITTPAYMVNISLKTPEEMTGEVVLTLESDSAVYSVSFTENNKYTVSTAFYPGQYSVTGVEASVDSKTTYQLAEQPTLTVDNKNLEVSWELQRVSVTDDDDKSQTSDNEGVNVGGTIQGFDTNGDLLSDTVKLAVAVGALFVVYGIIKYRRKKKEELNK